MESRILYTKFPSTQGASLASLRGFSCVLYLGHCVGTLYIARKNTQYSLAVMLYRPSLMQCVSRPPLIFFTRPAALLSGDKVGVVDFFCVSGHWDSSQCSPPPLLEQTLYTCLFCMDTTSPSLLLHMRTSFSTYVQHLTLLPLYNT